MTDSRFDYITENYNRICANVCEAKVKYRQSDDDIRIMAVTKTVPAEAVNHAISLGIHLLGENRVQEYLSKKDLYDSSAEVQFIGHLQTNKVKYIISDVSMIQSVDSVKLAEEINRRAMKLGIVKDVLVEINIGGEDSKSGIDAVYLDELIDEMSEMSNIRVKGLMTIPPPECSENFYAKMQQLYIDNRGKKRDNVSMSILSMGMSSDYVTAVKYGANLLRIGTALFGARDYSKAGK